MKTDPLFILEWAFDFDRCIRCFETDANEYRLWDLQSGNTSTSRFSCSTRERFAERRSSHWYVKILFILIRALVYWNDRLMVLIYGGMAPIMLDTKANRDAMPNADRSTWTPLSVVAEVHSLIHSISNSLASSHLIFFLLFGFWCEWFKFKFKFIDLINLSDLILVLVIGTEIERVE